jgi:purine-binding chemotaxis protein CheW
MTQAVADAVVVFTLGDLRFALNIGAVERVISAVEISPLPEAPRGVSGVFNYKGKIVPVFDLRQRFGLPERAVRLSDHLIIAHTHWRVVALMVDAVSGVVAQSEVQLTPALEILPDLECVSGVMKLDGNLVMVHDLERFLSIEDHEALQLALNL